MSHVDEDDDDLRPSYPFSPWGLAYEIVTLFSVVMAAVATFFERVAADFGSHNNEAIDRRRERDSRRLLMDDLRSLEQGEAL